MLLACLVNVIKRGRMKEAEHMWLVAQLAVCFVLLSCYSILRISALLIAEDYGVIAFLCTSIFSIILVFSNHIQSVSLRSRQRGSTSGMWLTCLSVSQGFIFRLLGLCCFTVLEQGYTPERVGRS